MKYTIWPIYTENGVCNTSDNDLASIWLRMCEEGKAQSVFYGGTVQNPTQFIEFMHQPTNLPVVVVDVPNREPVFLAWINGIQNGFGYGHFCSLGPFRRGAFQTVIEYWRGWRLDNGELIIKTLMGLTPETNKQAIRMIKLMGFTTLTPSVPDVCDMAYEGRRVGGIISYLSL